MSNQALIDALHMITTTRDGVCDNGYSPEYVAKEALAATASQVPAATLTDERIIELSGESGLHCFTEEHRTRSIRFARALLSTKPSPDAVRDAALEEAAAAIERDGRAAWLYADQIRRLKSSPLHQGEEKGCV